MSLWSDIKRLFTREPRKPLAARRPSREELGQIKEDVPLGMEAIDIDYVEQMARRNDALERANGVHAGKNVGMLRRAATFVAPMPEDETYAARYHRAFHKETDTK